MGYPANRPAKPSPKARGQAERAENLTGTRSEVAPEKMAVTREDAGKLGQVKLKASRALAAPTMDQYNALLEDVQQIANALNAMGAKFAFP